MSGQANRPTNSAAVPAPVPRPRLPRRERLADPLAHAHRSCGQATAGSARRLRIFTVKEGGAEHISLDRLRHVSTYVTDWYR